MVNKKLKAFAGRAIVLSKIIYCLDSRYNFSSNIKNKTASAFGHWLNAEIFRLRATIFIVQAVGYVLPIT